MWMGTGLGTALEGRESMLGGNLGRGLCLGGTHVGAGTPSKGQQPVNDQGWNRGLARRKEQGKKRAKKQEQQQKSDLYCPPPHPRDWQGLSGKQ